MPPLRLVLDTNVALDLLHWGNQSAAPLFRWLRDEAVLWLTDEACTDEFRRVLGYSEFRLDAAAQSSLAAQYARLARALTPAERIPLPARIPLCRDRDDQKFLELALAVGADVLLTRDKALLKLARRIRGVAPQLVIATPSTHLPKLLPAAPSAPP